MDHGRTNAEIFARSRNRSRPRLRTPRLLLAEDDDDMRTLIARALRKDGYEVIEVGDGISLMERLARRSQLSDDAQGFDLLISDIHMPGPDGLDALASLSWNDGPALPVILMTAFGDADTHARAHHLGAAALFDKPFDLDDLRTAAMNLLQ